MKKRIITAISFVMLIVLCFTYVSCANIPNNATTEVETFENASLEVVEVTEEFTEESVISSSKYEKPGKMKLNSTGSTTYAKNYLSQTLVATVLPEIASNKDVIWSIAWANPSSNNESEDVTYYFDVVPSSENSNKAEVRCYHEPCFADNEAIVTATTVEGGFTATCIVRYVGKPVDIIVTSNSLEYNDYDGFLMPINRNLGYKAEFDIEFFNPVGMVNTDMDLYVLFDKLSIEGRINVADYHIDNDTGEGYYELSTLKSIPFRDYYKNYLSVKIINGKLVVEFDFSEFCSKTMNYGEETICFEKYYSMSEQAPIYLEFEVHNGKGLYTLVKIKFFEIPGDVILDKDEIIF